MTSLDNKQCNERDSGTKKVQWSNNKQQEDEKDSNKNFVTLRKSRKSTTLNDPVEFGKTPIEQSVIKRMVVLPTGGCCDMDYVLSKQNQSKIQSSSEKITQHTTPSAYPGSITINIGPTMPFHLNPTLQNYNPKSRSTLTSNQKLLNEEQWVPDERIIPSLEEPVAPYVSASHYSESKVPRIYSREQRVINLDTTQNTFDEENLTYITKSSPPPKISPFKCCWNWLRCKRKGKKDEVYLPSIMKVKEQQNNNIMTYQTMSRGTSFDSRFVQPEFIRPSVIPSRLSTIIESEMSSQNLSQESITQDVKKA